MSFADFPRGHSRAPARNAPLATAAWCETAPLYQEGDLWLGLDAEGREVGCGDDRHAVLVAGSRAGKGRSVLIPNLLRWPGSCVVNDPKGENATITAAIRAARPGHTVAVVDPKGAAKVPDALRVTFNPLDLIDGDDDDAIDLAAAIGDAVMIGSGDGKDVHWNESARQVFEAVLLHVATTEEGPARSLVRVRQLLTLGDPERADILTALNRAENPDDCASVSPFEALWSSMAQSEAANPAVRDVIAGAANSVLDMGDNERGSVLSTARRNTKFIDSPWMRRCLEGGGRRFDIDALKSEPGGVTVYLCLSARFIPTHARFLRLVLNLMLFRMEAQGLDKPACGHSVLYILDEAAALGRMEAIEKAAGLMAGYGVKLWTVLQDLGQLKRHYKESWETFLGNAGVMQFFANSDMTTLEWLSKRLGQTEVIRETRSTSTSQTTSKSLSQSRTENTGWSTSSGQTRGQSDMAELQSMATREGGQGLMPFIARAGASGAGHSISQSAQEGRTGGESQQRGDSTSAGESRTENSSETVHQTELMAPVELAAYFDREQNRQVVILGGNVLALSRLSSSRRDVP